jgi:hypothetical protein
VSLPCLSPPFLFLFSSSSLPFPLWPSLSPSLSPPVSPQAHLQNTQATLANYICRLLVSRGVSAGSTCSS